MFNIIDGSQKELLRIQFLDFIYQLCELKVSNGTLNPKLYLGLLNYELIEEPLPLMVLDQEMAKTLGNYLLNFAEKGYINGQ